MAVFPKQSVHSIPKPLRHLITEKESPIIDFYPTSFKLDLNGFKFSYQGVNILPFVEKDRLLSEIRKYEDQFTEEEKERNSFGSALIMFDKNNGPKTLVEEVGETRFVEPDFELDLESAPR